MGLVDENHPDDVDPSRAVRGPLGVASTRFETGETISETVSTGRGIGTARGATARAVTTIGTAAAAIEIETEDHDPTTHEKLLADIIP